MPAAALLTMAIFLVLMAFLLPVGLRFRGQVYIGLFLHLALFSFGIILVKWNDARLHTARFGAHENQWISGTILEPPRETARAWKLTIAVHYAGNHSRLSRASGKLLAYLNKTHNTLPPQVGSEVLVHQAPTPLKSTGNPYSFDFSRRALFQGITHRLSTSEYALLQPPSNYSIRHLLDLLRKEVLDILRRYIPGKKEQGLAEALLIGYKDDLDDELVRAYSITGVVHIIAISGLHLGLIYMLMSLLLRPLKRSATGRILRAIVIIIALWIFSLVAGAQPSILRSAVMFTCLALGELISRRSSGLNTLAASAFLILCVDPYSLWDAGFQLSYAAVLGIMLFMKPVYALWYIRNKFLDLIWQMNAVTISAQVFTVPLTIYYFRQFPLLFLVSNFLPVPLSSLVLFAELLLCCLSPFPLLARMAGKVCSWLITTMNDYIAGVELIPLATWSRLSINLAQAWLLAVLVPAIVVYWLHGKKTGLWLALGAGLLFISLRSISFYQARRQQVMICYNIPRTTAIVFIDGREWRYLGDKSGLEASAFNFHLQPHHIHARLQEQPTQAMSTRTCNISWNKKTIAVVHGDRLSARFVKADVLLIAGTTRLTAIALATHYQPKKVVITGNISRNSKSRLIAGFKELGTDVHVISEEGAFAIY